MSVLAQRAGAEWFVFLERSGSKEPQGDNLGDLNGPPAAEARKFIENAQK